MLWLIALYVVGFGFTCGATDRLGERNPRTRGSSFSGSSFIDMMACFLWPLTWAIYVPLKLGAWVIR